VQIDTNAFSKAAKRHGVNSGITMGTEREFKEKVKHDYDGRYKVERESKDEFGNKVKEKHERNH
jgi:hypothetical protein